RHFGLQPFNFQLAEITQLDLRVDLEYGNELQVLALIQGFRFDARLAGRLQLLLADCFVEGFAHYFAKHFLANTLAEPPLDDAHRHLALAEAVKADLAGSFLQAGRHGILDNGCGHSNRHATLKAGCGLNRNLHEISSYLNEMPSSRRLSS